MNITGYKKHKKIMQEMLAQESAKPELRQNRAKLNRLEKSIENCSDRIKALQKKKKELKKKGR
jgi:chromosome segregation ATPase